MGTWWLSSGQQELGVIGPLGRDEGACDCYAASLWARRDGLYTMPRHPSGSKLCIEVRKPTTAPESFDLQLEAGHLRLLRFLQESSAHQRQLEGELQSMVAEFRRARVRPSRFLLGALDFCMRSPRWPEVLLATQREHRKLFAPR